MSARILVVVAWVLAGCGDGASGGDVVNGPGPTAMACAAADTQVVASCTTAAGTCIEFDGSGWNGSITETQDDCRVRGGKWEQKPCALACMKGTCAVEYFGTKCERTCYGAAYAGDEATARAECPMGATFTPGK